MASIPLLVRWVLPSIGTASLRTLSSDRVAAYRDAVVANGPPAETIEGCFEILDDILACAVNWGLITRSPIVETNAKLGTVRLGEAKVIPLPGCHRGDGVQAPA